MSSQPRHGSTSIQSPELKDKHGGDGGSAVFPQPIPAQQTKEKSCGLDETSLSELLSLK